MAIGEPSHDESSNLPCLWCVSEYYLPNFSGAAIQAHRILRLLVERGFPVRVLAMADQACRSLAGQSARIDGVEVQYLPVLRQRSWGDRGHSGRMRAKLHAINRSLRDLTFQLRQAWILHRHARPGDILQLYIVDDWTWVTLRVARWKRMRTIIQISLVGADDPASFRSSWWGISTAWKAGCFRQVDRVIGLSRALTDSCLQAGVPQEKILRIPNGVDLGVFPGVSPALRESRCRELGLAPAATRIVFVGSAIRRKGIDTAVEAFRILARRRPEVELLVVGPDDFSDATRHDASRAELVDRLRQSLTQDGIDGRVRWTGEVEPSMIAGYLQASDIFFFPTRREGLPNALAEAMACGLPCVASRLEGITTDLVESDEQGLLVASESAEAHAAALDRLCDSAALRHRLGRAARERIERDFTLPATARQYESLYRQLDAPAPVE